MLLVRLFAVGLLTGLVACGTSSDAKPDAKPCDLVATLQQHGSSANLAPGEITETLQQVFDQTRANPDSELAKAAAEARRTHDALVAETGLSRDFLDGYERLLVACHLDPT